MDATSFTESKEDWTALFGKIFTVYPDRIALQHDDSSREISIQVRSNGSAEKKKILDLMKNERKFISLITESIKNQVPALEEYKATKVTKPTSSK